MDPLICNKRELAFKVLHCSLPTVDALLERYSDFPVKTRGSNGVPWEFVAADCVEFLQRKKTEETAASEAQSAERLGFFEQFKLPIDDVAGEEAAKLTPAQRAQMAQARLREQELGVKTGQLVPVGDVRRQYADLFRSIGQFLDTLPGQLGRAHGLPETVIRAMRQSIDEQRRNFVRDLDAKLSLDNAAA
jgi:phage terminase Nu1 subunit (DNA packaging protein)